ncbi:hypothetical protein QQF64_028138 [Cirrhinus molitorella]|uniref:Uncharacterized protein n=1 Tax=Cirrhinus molitorella TaxID=172907 RepID=A0ABR3N5W4_9TELE
MLSYADSCRLIERQPTAVISVTKRQVASTRPSLKLRTASDSRPFFVIFFLQLIFSSCWLTVEDKSQDPSEPLKRVPRRVPDLNA